MAFSTHAFFWECIKETADNVAIDLMNLTGTFPDEVWDGFPDEYYTEAEDGSKSVTLDNLIEWFHYLFDELEPSDWLETISAYADACDRQRKQEQAEAKAPAATEAPAGSSVNH